MITIRHERLDTGAREALLDAAFGADPLHASRRTSCAKAALPADGLSFVAVEDGRVVGTVRLWHVAAGAGTTGAAARPARRRPDVPQPRHRRRADAPRACARRGGAATAPCCWSATPPTTAGSASRPRRPARCGCPARTSGTGCWRCELVAGALDGARGADRRDRPAGAQADAAALVALAAAPAPAAGAAPAGRLTTVSQTAWTPRGNSVRRLFRLSATGG